MRRLSEYFSDAIVVIGIHSAKFPAEQISTNIQASLSRHNIEHPIVNDKDFIIWQQYALRAWPTIKLIDPKGKIHYTQEGEIDAEYLIPIIKDLIDEFESKGELVREPRLLKSNPPNKMLTPLAFPSKLVNSSDGRLYISDTGNHRILEVLITEETYNGKITRVFGNGRKGLNDGSILTASFNHPQGLALSGEFLYVADTDNHAIRVVDLTTETVHTIAGTGEKGKGWVVPTLPTKTPLRSPIGLLLIEEEKTEKKHILFIAMAGSHQIWVLSVGGYFGIFAGNGREALVDGDLANASFNQPSDLAFGLNHLIIADAEASAIRAISLSKNSKVYTLIGEGLFEYGDVDGIGEKVRLQHPLGLAFGNNLIYIADSYNHKIKVLDPSTNQVNTLIGNGQPGFADGIFKDSSLYQPEGISFYNHFLYIADTNNHLIRVADIEKNIISSLVLSGLERLNLPNRDKVNNRNLDTVLVSPGEVEFHFDIHLPEGYKLNPHTPIICRLIAGKYENLRSLQVAENCSVTFEIQGDQNLTFDFIIYFCKEGAESLCFIHNRRTIVPIKVSSHAPKKITIPYEIETIESVDSE